MEPILPLGDNPADTVSQEAKRFGLTTTSGQRTVQHNKDVGGAANSNHLSGNAYDFAGDPQKMRQFTEYMRDAYGDNLSELYHDPVGGYKAGKSIGPIGDHSDHVHVAWPGAGIQSQGHEEDPDTAMVKFNARVWARYPHSNLHSQKLLFRLIHFLQKPVPPNTAIAGGNVAMTVTPQTAGNVYTTQSATLGPRTEKQATRPGGMGAGQQVNISDLLQPLQSGTITPEEFQRQVQERYGQQLGFNPAQMEAARQYYKGQRVRLRPILF